MSSSLDASASISNKRFKFYGLLWLTLKHIEFKVQIFWSSVLPAVAASNYQPAKRPINHGRATKINPVSFCYNCRLGPERLVGEKCWSLVSGSRSGFEEQGGVSRWSLFQVSTCFPPPGGDELRSLSSGSKAGLRRWPAGGLLLRPGGGRGHQVVTNTISYWNELRDKWISTPAQKREGKERAQRRVAFK